VEFHFPTLTVLSDFILLLTRAFEENPEEGIKQCQILLEEPDLESGVRVGDVYGVMIEYYARRDRWKAVNITIFHSG
jgi:hypothetical protein